MAPKRKRGAPTNAQKLKPPPGNYRPLFSGGAVVQIGAQAIQPEQQQQQQQPDDEQEDQRPAEEQWLAEHDEQDGEDEDAVSDLQEDCNKRKKRKTFEVTLSFDVQIPWMQHCNCTNSLDVMILALLF